MILTDRVLRANEYAEAYSGNYYFNCSTYNEVKASLASDFIFISKGETLTEFNPKPDRNYVLVEFSTEDHFDEHEWRWMTVQKAYLKRFQKRLNEMFKRLDT